MAKRNDVAQKVILEKINGDYVLYNYPLSSVDNLFNAEERNNISIPANGEYKISNPLLGESNISFTSPNTDFKLILSNDLGEKVALIFDSASSLLMLDRTESGITDFNYEFGNKLHYVPMQHLGESINISMYLDRSSIEVFVNQGLYSLTDQLFPRGPYNTLRFENLSNTEILTKDWSIRTVRPIW